MSLYTYQGLPKLYYSWIYQELDYYRRVIQQFSFFISPPNKQEAKESSWTFVYRNFPKFVDSVVSYYFFHLPHQPFVSMTFLVRKFFLHSLFPVLSYTHITQRKVFPMSLKDQSRRAFPYPFQCCSKCCGKPSWGYQLVEIPFHLQTDPKLWIL